MATLQKLPSGNWRAQFHIVGRDGKRHRKSVTAPTRWQAEKLATEYAEKAEQDASRFTVAQALHGYIDLKRNVPPPQRSEATRAS